MKAALVHKRRRRIMAVVCALMSLAGFGVSVTLSVLPMRGNDMMAAQFNALLFCLFSAFLADLSHEFLVRRRPDYERGSTGFRKGLLWWLVALSAFFAVQLFCRAGAASLHGIYAAGMGLFWIGLGLFFTAAVIEVHSRSQP